MKTFVCPNCKHTVQTIGHDVRHSCPQNQHKYNSYQEVKK